MEKAKKKFKDIFSNAATVKPDIEVQESLSSKNVKLSRVARHGFPHNPTCMAYDPIQKLLAIGQNSGSIRLLGEPGVDVSVEHESSSAVLSLQFLVNEGALVSVCRDDTIHLWNLRQKRPEIVHSLQFQKEQITCATCPFGSKWFYIGTERGNVHVASVADFELSGYVINWNKAIDLSKRTHPGPVRHLSECPSDEGRLLIGFDKGLIVLWDLRAKVAESRYCCSQVVRDLSWHFEGKSFLASHGDGSLSIWNVRKGNGPKDEPATCWAPHSRANAPDRPTEPPSSSTPRERCRPIPQVEWKHGKGGSEELLVFSGGLPLDESGVLPGLTILRGGKSATVLEMEDNIVAFTTLCHSAYPNEAAEPFAVAVLLLSDLLIVDLNTPGYPCFQNPYPMDIHESPVTLCSYLADCPSDLIGLYYSAGAKQKRTGFVDKPWPITGGSWGVSASGKEEIILTGHADGSLKFWNAASEQLQLLYKMKTGRHMERPEEAAVRDMDPLAVTALAFCPDSLLLAVAAKAAQVTLFKFHKTEASNEVPVLEVPILYMAPSELEEQAAASREEQMRRQQSASSEASVSTSLGSKCDLYFPIKARGGPLKRPSGYQPDLVCLTPWMSPYRPEEVASIALNSAYGLLAPQTPSSAGGPNKSPTTKRERRKGDVKRKLKGGVRRLQLVQQATARLNSRRSRSIERAEDVPGSPGSPLPLAHSQPASSASLAVQGGEAGVGAAASVGANLRKGGSGESRSGRSQGREGGGVLGPTASAGGGSSVGLSLALRKPFSKAVSLALPSPSAPASERPSLESSKSVSPSILGDKERPRLQHAPHSLTSSPGPPPPPSQPVSGSFTDKEVSISRSSSCDSNDAPLCSEAVTSLAFLSAYTQKGADCEAVAEVPSLWVGTSTGSVLLLNLSIPSSTSRLNSPVTGSHSTSIFRGRGAILELGFMDSSFSLVTGPTDKKAFPKEGQPLPRNKGDIAVVYKSRVSVLSSSEEDSLEEAYVVLVSERSIQVIQLPTQATLYTTRLDSGIVKATVTTLQSSPIVVALSSNGRIQVFSLPSLRPLLDRPLLTPSHQLGRRTLVFSHEGHGAYMVNPSEMEKISICAETGRQCSDVLGDLFVGQALPEREKPGFLKGIFSSAATQVDRDEIFKAEQGRASKTVARTIQGSGLSAVSAADIKGDGPMAAVARTKLALMERTEKLNKVEEATEKMAESSERYAKNANELMNKMKNKKWYQW